MRRVSLHSEAVGSRSRAARNLLISPSFCTTIPSARHGVGGPGNLAGPPGGVLTAWSAPCVAPRFWIRRDHNALDVRPRLPDRAGRRCQESCRAFHPPNRHVGPCNTPPSAPPTYACSTAVPQRLLTARFRGSNLHRRAAGQRFYPTRFLPTVTAVIGATSSSRRRAASPGKKRSALSAQREVT